MIKTLRNQKQHLFLYAMLFTSLFFDALTFFDVASVSRTASIIFMLGYFLLAGKESIISAFQSMSLVSMLLLYLLVRSVVTGVDFGDPYFIALFLNLLMAISVVGVMQKINQPTVVFCLTFFIVSMFAICAVFGWGVERSLQDFRTSFLALNSNEYSALLLIGLVSGLYFTDVIFLKYERVSWFCFIGFIFILLAIFSSGTRFAIIGAILSIFFYAIMVYRRYGRRNLALLYCSIVFVAVLLEVVKVYFSDVYYGDSALLGSELISSKSQERSSFLERFDFVNTGINHNVSSLGGRVELWFISIKAFLSAPFIGLGYEGLKEFSILDYGHFARPHNALLEVLAIGGVLGFVFLLWIVWWVFKTLSTSPRDLEMTLLVIFPLAIISMMLNVSSLKLFWVYLGIGVYFLRSKPRCEVCQ